MRLSSSFLGGVRHYQRRGVPYPANESFFVLAFFERPSHPTLIYHFNTVRWDGIRCRDRQNRPNFIFQAGSGEIRATVGRHPVADSRIAEQMSTRTLFFDQYVALMLVTLFSPSIDSMRSICRASDLKSFGRSSASNARVGPTTHSCLANYSSRSLKIRGVMFNSRVICLDNSVALERLTLE